MTGTQNFWFTVALPAIQYIIAGVIAAAVAWIAVGYNKVTKKEMDKAMSDALNRFLTDMAGGIIMQLRTKTGRTVPPEVVAEIDANKILEAAKKRIPEVLAKHPELTKEELTKRVTEKIAQLPEYPNPETAPKH